MTTLWRSRGTIMLVALAGGLLMGLLGLSRPVLYEAKAQLIISTPSSTTVGGVATVSQESINEAIDSHLTRLVSQAQLRRTVSYLEIHDEKSTLEALRAKGEASGTVTAVTRSLRTWTIQLRQLFQGNDQNTEPAVDKDAALLTSLRNGIRVGQELRSRVISVGFTDTDRVHASAVANTFTQAYVEQLSRQSRASFERDLGAVNARVPDVQRKLAAAIEKKEKFLIEMGGSDLADGDATIAEIAQLKQLLSSAQTKLVAAQSQGIASKIQSGANIEHDIQFYDTHINALEQRISDLESIANDGAIRLSAIKALDLEIDAQSSQYKDILSKRESLRQHVEAPFSGVSILSAAWTPVDPKTISPLFLVPPGMIIFGLMGAIFAVIRHSADDTIRSDTESEDALGIACAGILPQLKDPTAKGLHQLVLGPHNAPYKRALSSIFVSLAPHHSNAKFSKLILVTSSTHNEGKTALAWSLALSAKRFGHSVLFIDLDTIQNQLTLSFRNEFGTIASGKNFGDFADGNCALKEAVESLQKADIDFMPAPKASADLLAQLSFDGIQQIIDKLRQDYNMVIVNGPPSAEAPELRLLAAQADAVLFAVRWGKTKRTYARAALKTFTRDGGDTSIISSVLTDVDLVQQGQYRFGDSADLLRSHE